MSHNAQHISMLAAVSPFKTEEAVTNCDSLLLLLLGFRQTSLSSPSAKLPYYNPFRRPFQRQHSLPPVIAADVMDGNAGEIVVAGPVRVTAKDAGDAGGVFLEDCCQRASGR